MNSSPCPCDAKEAIRARAIELGAVACGFARVAPVDAEAEGQYQRWVDSGRCATMDYCRRYAEVRRDPALLLEGARTIISCAFNYYSPDPDIPPGHIRIARYARGADYHHVVKQRLLQLGEYLTANYGGDMRACVDTAPIRERYWAQQAGVGFVGRNNQLIVPGVGSYVFLGELLWTGEITPDQPMEQGCGDCMACVRACPGGALNCEGACDARRCLSYLTIEHRGPWPEDCFASKSEKLQWNYGCDCCLEACPHNAHHPVTEIPEFTPDPAIISLTPADLLAMTSSHFRRLTRHSAISRITLAQMHRNIK